ncbi:MAG: hypothetical protein OHK0028_02790 [Deltaproteobacteria bacterium]
MRDGTDRIDAEELRAEIPPGFPWAGIEVLDVTDSTNRVAMEMADRGSPHGSIVVADAQTAGRGRMGRRWVSPPGKNLYVSLLLRPPVPAAAAPRFSLVAGVALADAVETLGVPAELKWPNDLYLGGGKAAGILAEAASDPGGVRHLVLGVGLNVNMEAADFPEELRGVATSLRIRTGRPVRRVGILARFLGAFADRYRGFLSGGLPSLLPDWDRRDFLRGKRVLARRSGSEAWGIACGVDADGALRFRRDGGAAEERLHSGEIVGFPR